VALEEQVELAEAVMAVAEVMLAVLMVEQILGVEEAVLVNGLGVQ